MRFDASRTTGRHLSGGVAVAVRRSHALFRLRWARRAGRCPWAFARCVMTYQVMDFWSGNRTRDTRNHVPML